MYIKSFRKANNISQKALAEFAGVTQSAVSQWESGLTNIPSPILQRLISNDKGWDTTALLEGAPASTDNSNHGAVTTIGDISGITNSPTTVNNGNAAELLRVIESQEEQISAPHEQIRNLTDIIRNLTSK